MTKANPVFSWVIGGKTFEFCCPPCVDEFVRMAKESPDDIMKTIGRANPAGECDSPGQPTA